MSDRQEQIKTEFMKMLTEAARSIDQRLKDSWAEGYKDGLMDAQQIIAGHMDVIEAREKESKTASVGLLIQEIDSELLDLARKKKVL